ncbi:MAG: secondary thiamine-phosphate synthase enzyme YjbQ [Planctomycetes bacterium]|nr:secondary thiamine-phosphate synthase enzyme YjbQ [Planctomycetota bacterium]
MQFNIQTNNHDEMISITSQVQTYVTELGVQAGLCMVYVPHTTAAVTINEDADPDVIHDILTHLDKMIPWKANYRHAEGNSAAHIKSSLVGTSVNVIIKNGNLVLGTWQSIFFCEFDGPRSRKFNVKIINGGA